MILVNETPYSAVLPSTVLDQERMAAALVARVTYALDLGKKKARVEVAAEQIWQASYGPLETPHGPLEAELPFMKGGVDLFLFGAARTPEAAPATKLEVAVEVGKFTRRALVSGNRIWLKNASSGFRPSAAAKFVAMPLTLANAFGGRDVWDGLEVPWAENPDGKGYVIAAEDVEGKPLPNLEEPGALVAAWSDRPPVCGFGFCSRANAARFRSGVVLDEKEQRIVDITPRYFNLAYAPMVAPAANAGDRVTVTGMRHEGPLVFDVPAAPFDLHLRFGNKEVVRTPTVDGIGIEVDERRLFVSYRFAFRYVVRPLELRNATLVIRKGKE
jgi:hypothetical protein